MSREKGGSASSKIGLLGKLSSWLWLTGVSLLIGAIPVGLGALMMLQRSGSHSYWCPRVPGQWHAVISCIPSLAGIEAAAEMTLAYASPFFVVGAAILLWINLRRGS